MWLMMIIGIIILFGNDNGSANVCFNLDSQSLAIKKQILDTMRPDAPLNINFRYIYLSTQCLHFLGVIITIFTQDITIFLSEHENKWYSTGSYYCSKMLLDVPNILVIAYTYATIAYYGGGQINDIYRFAYYTVFTVSLTQVDLVVKAPG